MKSWMKEYRDLVIETRRHLQTLLPKKESPPPTLVPKRKEPTPIPPSLSSQVEKESETTKVSIQKNLIATQIVGPFILEKNSPFLPIDLSLMSQTMKKLAPPETFCLALHKKELPFLQKIADALTERALPCKAVLLDKKAMKERLLTCQMNSFLLGFDAEVAQMLSLSEKVVYHKPLPFSSNRILFLHPIDHYESDIELKRNLWNSLKTLLPQ